MSHDDGSAAAARGRRPPARGAAVLEAAVEIARAWAGPDVLALMLGGSHASREAVWIELDGRTLTVSDVDLYALMPDRSAVGAAEARRRRGLGDLPARLLELGVAAPLEVAFFTPEDLARTTARTATVELKRHARVVAGEDRWLDRIPRFAARDIPQEEVQLLLENRAFELLYAHALAGSDDVLDRYRTRHATLKTAIDLAGVMCLASGEYPEGGAAKVAWARGLKGMRLEKEPPWSDAMAWRQGDTRLPEADAAHADWMRTARAWSELMRRRMGLGASDDPARAWLETARRARGRRRLRDALTFVATGGRGPSLASRLRAMGRGTPQHRLNASAGAWLMRLAGGREDDAFADSLERVMMTLGVVRETGEGTSRALVRCWDHWVLDGQRTATWT